MARTIRTQPFTLDRAAILRATWLLPLMGRFVFLVVALATLVVGGLRSGQRGLAYGGLIGAVIGVPFALMARYARDRRRLDLPDAAFDAPRTMEFTDKGFRERIEAGAESKVPWSGVRKARRRGGLVLLSVERRFVAIPESAFATDADRAALWGLLREKGLIKARGA